MPYPRSLRGRREVACRPWCGRPGRPDRRLMTSTRDSRGAAWPRLDTDDRSRRWTSPRATTATETGDPHSLRGRYFSVAQVARMYGISSVTLYRAINAGEFPAVRIRGRVIVPGEALDKLVAAALAENTVIDAADWAAER